MFSQYIANYFLKIVQRNISKNMKIRVRISPVIVEGISIKGTYVAKIIFID